MERRLVWIFHPHVAFIPFFWEPQLSEDDHKRAPASFPELRSCCPASCTVLARMDDRNTSQSLPASRGPPLQEQHIDHSPPWGGPSSERLSPRCCQQTLTPRIHRLTSTHFLSSPPDSPAALASAHLHIHLRADLPDSPSDSPATLASPHLQTPLP